MKTIEKAKFGGQLAIIYHRQKATCNEVGCRVQGIHGLTRDHIIPKAVARLYGWDREMYESHENKQLLCPMHHQKKDRNVNQRIHNILKRKEVLDKIKQLKYVPD